MRHDVDAARSRLEAIAIAHAQAPAARRVRGDLVLDAGQARLAVGDRRAMLRRARGAGDRATHGATGIAVEIEVARGRRLAQPCCSTASHGADTRAPRPADRRRTRRAPAGSTSRARPRHHATGRLRSRLVIAYVTDVEGRSDKLVSFADGNPHVALARRRAAARRRRHVRVRRRRGRSRTLRPRIVATLLAARRAYGDRVVLLAGNHDIDKLRLARRADRRATATAPALSERGALLRSILANTMGASKASSFAPPSSPRRASLDDDASSQLPRRSRARSAPSRVSRRVSPRLSRGRDAVLARQHDRRSFGEVPGAARAADV